MKDIILSNGVAIPSRGYGVYLVTKEECEECVLNAIKVGYRHIDTAQAYYNEEEVGEAIVKCGLPRNELFITTKVWVSNYGDGVTYDSVIESLRKLKTDYIDLILLHQPFADYYGAWRDLEKLYKEGKVRAIGVSNFYPDRLVDLTLHAEIKPMINQIEINPFFQRKYDKEWNDKYGVVLEAWAPFGEGRRDMFTNPILKEIGDKYGKSNAQVILRWLYQRGIVSLAKSVHEDRMAQNFDIDNFELSDADMQKISDMDEKASLFMNHQSPESSEFFYNFSKK